MSKKLAPAKTVIMCSFSYSFMRVLNHALKSTELFWTLMVASLLDATWRHLYDLRKFSAKLKIFPPAYLEIPYGYHTT